MTPLMLACRNWSVETVTLLLSLGADPNLRDANGLTARDYLLMNNQATPGSVLTMSSRYFNVISTSLRHVTSPHLHPFAPLSSAHPFTSFSSTQLNQSPQSDVTSLSSHHPSHPVSAHFDVAKSILQHIASAGADLNPRASKGDRDPLCLALASNTLLLDLALAFYGGGKFYDAPAGSIPFKHLITSGLSLTSPHLTSTYPAHPRSGQLNSTPHFSVSLLLPNFLSADSGPFHQLVLTLRPDLDMIQRLFEARPEALAQLDSNARTPLIVAVRSSRSFQDNSIRSSHVLLPLPLSGDS